MFNTDHINQVKSWLKTASNIVITAHRSADGDSVGSSLALYHYLKALGHTPVICHPDQMPDFYTWLEESDHIITYDNNMETVEAKLKAADLIFCLDYNQTSRVGQMETALSGATAKKVMIDHHQEPEQDDFDILFSFPTISSTCELIYRFIESCGDLTILNEKIGTPIYCGIMTDTGSFRFPSTTADTHQIIAHLIKVGVKNHVIHEQTFDTNSINKIKLNGYALSEKLTILEEYSVAYIALNKKELETYNAVKGDTEGLVNKALSISGIKMAVFLKEDQGYIKLSFRSKGETYVNTFAKTHFNGGGHIYAAGGKFNGSMDSAIKKLVTYIPSFVNS